ncbi:MAG: Eco57I restriction-modification methylase domain-containing protein [Planctomycetes bacterium]|nr:Eco57I restriction-modification methylase domain-containing protein [Planctomycetota bacterium]
MEALTASGDTDPNEAFRYWWLFFRPVAFSPLAPTGRGVGGEGEQSWLDAILQGSREYARRLGDRLKERIFFTIFPHLAQGFLEDRQQRLSMPPVAHAPGSPQAPGSPGKRPETSTEDELGDIFEATLTLLYRLLFLLYAESRDLLPIREAPYYATSLKKIKEEIADKGGVAESEVPDRLSQAYSARDTTLYDRLGRLFRAMDKGDPVLNVPAYNGGLFNTTPASLASAGRGAGGEGNRREQRIARFLLEHKVPNRYLALAIDRLARDQDERTLGLVFIDYKSLEVRHLGSIYEGLLEFKLKVAEEDLTTQADKKGERYIPLSKVQASRKRKRPEVVVHRKEVYLSNDKAERKASGSYYTPDPIVEYIVANTVGPVLDEKLEALHGEFRKVRKTFDNEVQKSKAYPSKEVLDGKMDHRQWAGQQTYNAHKDLVERLFDLRVLDPAMGSGHFLVKAVEFLTEHLLKFLNQFPINPLGFLLDQTRRNILRSLNEEQGIDIFGPLEEVGKDRNNPWTSKLTDINLLKRHVLKRCIYGVDLNPMAVELAKVSMWLDAFTLGAPLNFLDHHLRCGNSLIGATFKELEEATREYKGYRATGASLKLMWSLDYEPLLKAIQHVLFVSKMADATAAEVAASIYRYDQARQALAGYQVFLDLLVAEHFGCKDGPAILQHGNPDAKSREEFLASLKEEWERRTVTQAEEIARRADLRFFHWEIEFPEVFFGFVDADQRQIKHKDRIKNGSAGFDVIVGNPPYVRQEAIKPLKPYLKKTYCTFDSTNDLYVYFQEREIFYLRVHGRMGMIVANKWMRAGYGERLRDFLQRTGQPLEVIDFGHSPIFPDADTFPCILLMTKRPQALTEKQKPAEMETMAACEVAREQWNNRMDLEAFVLKRRHRIPTRFLRKEGWSIEDPRIQALFERIRRTCRPLSETIGTSPLMGIKTGFNEAFVLDVDTASRLTAQSSTSRQILRPLLRGRDADRWLPKPSDVMLIHIPSSENVDWPWSKYNENRARKAFKEAYPAIYEFMSAFEEELKARQDQGRFWWEFRSCAYYDKLTGPKLVIQSIAYHSLFCRATPKDMPNNSVFFLPTDDVRILAILNSPFAWSYMYRSFPHKKDEAIAMDSAVVATLPLPPDLAGDALRDRAERLLENVAARKEWEATVLAKATREFGVPENEPKLLSWLALPSDEFTTRIQAIQDGPKLTGALLQKLGRFHLEARSREVEFFVQQLELEQTLAGLVEDAYGLTSEERELMRSTRPVRDPLDVLEAKIRGGIEGPGGNSTEE